MGVIAIIQARCGSSRLPNKVLLEIEKGKTIIERVYDQISKSKYVDNVVVAIPDLEIDDKLAGFLMNKSIPFYRGDENDVLSRFCKYLNNENHQFVIRATADNPFIDTKTIDYLILNHLFNESDYTYSNDLPIGTCVEVFNRNILLNLNKKDDLQDYHREHVTIFFKENPQFYSINFVEFPAFKKHYLEMRLTIDTEEDYCFALKLNKLLNKDYSIQNLIRIFKSNKQLFKENSYIKQKVR